MQDMLMYIFNENHPGKTFRKENTVKRGLKAFKLFPLIRQYLATDFREIE